MTGAASAVDMVNGIDLHKVKWPLLCPNVRAMQYDQNGLVCDVSHPASKMHNSKVQETIAEHIPQANSCEALQSEFDTLTTPQEGVEGEEWKTCYMVFKSALYDRLSRPDRYIHSSEDWINVHFNKDTMEK